jgi:hypothetical protein
VESAKVRSAKCKRGKPCKRSAKVSVQVDRAAAVKLTVSYKRHVGRKWRYVRVAVKTITTSNGTVRWTVRGTRGRSLSRGTYRLEVSPASDAGRGTTRRLTFKVR